MRATESGMGAAADVVLPGACSPDSFMSMFVQAALRFCIRDSILGGSWHTMFEIVRRGLTRPVGLNQENVFSRSASELWQPSCLVLDLQRWRSACVRRSLAWVLLQVFVCVIGGGCAAAAQCMCAAFWAQWRSAPRRSFQSRWHPWRSAPRRSWISWASVNAPDAPRQPGHMTRSCAGRARR